MWAQPFCTIILNPLDNLALRMDFSGMYNFVILQIEHLENTGSLSYLELRNIGKCYFTISRYSYLLMSLSVSLEETLSIKKSSSSH